MVKSHGFWLLFADDVVEKMDVQATEEFYGLTSDIKKKFRIWIYFILSIKIIT